MKEFILQILAQISVTIGTYDPFDKERWVLIPENTSISYIWTNAENISNAICSELWEALSLAVSKIGNTAPRAGNTANVDLVLKCAYFEDVTYA